MTQNPRVGSDYDRTMRSSASVRGNRGKTPWGTEPQDRGESAAEVARGMISRGAKNLELKTVKVENFNNPGTFVKQRALVGTGKNGQTMQTLLSESDFRRYKAEVRDGDGKIKVKISKG